MPSDVKFEPLAKDSALVLSVVRKQDIDGYWLMNLTGLAPDKLKTAVEDLSAKKLVQVTGSMDVSQIGDSYISVPVQAKGYADMYLGNYTLA